MTKRIFLGVLVVLILSAIPLGAYLHHANRPDSNRARSASRKEEVRSMKEDARNMQEEGRADELVAAIERKIEQAELMGATPQQVIAFLEREKLGELPFSYITNSSTNVSRKLGEIDNYVLARKRGVARHIGLFQITPIDVQVMFAFDEQNHMKAYAVEKVGDVGIPL